MFFVAHFHIQMLFIFSKFWFPELLGGAGGRDRGKKQKMAQHDKIFFVSLGISETVPNMIVVFGTHE